MVVILSSAAAVVNGVLVDVIQMALCVLGKDTKLGDKTSNGSQTTSGICAGPQSRVCLARWLLITTHLRHEREAVGGVDRPRYL